MNAWVFDVVAVGSFLALTVAGYVLWRRHQWRAVQVTDLLCSIIAGLSAGRHAAQARWSTAVLWLVGAVLAFLAARCASSTRREVRS